MSAEFTLIADLAREVVPPADGILSRTLLNDPRLKVVLFGFGAGQELSEHTASVPAVLHILSGEAELRLGTSSSPAGPGTWVHMPPHLPHGIKARTPTVMLLMMLKSGS